MKKIIDFILSKTFKNSFGIFLFVLLMTIAVSSQNFFFQKVVENGISKRDIVAQKDIRVIDIKKTELHKKEVVQAVEPILTQTEDDYIFLGLDELQNSITEIRKKTIPYSEKKDELSSLMAENQNMSVVEYLLKITDNDLISLFDKSRDVLKGVMDTGISSKDFDNNNVSKIIKSNIKTSTPRAQVSIIIGILNHVIAPNLVIDETATDIAKKNAQSAVKPYEYVFKQGQKIIAKGDRITDLKKEALREAGYNILEINIGGIAGVMLLIAFFTFIFLQYEKQYEKEFYNSKYLYLTASLTVFVALISTMLPTGFSPYIIPIPAYATVLSIFTTPRNSFFATTLLLAILSVSMQYNIEVIIVFLFLNAAISITMSRLKFSKRSDLLITSLKISCVGVFVVGTIYLLEKYMMEINNVLILSDLGYIVLNCFVISGILLLGVLPIIENTFGILTPYGLSELADHNQPLLKKLLSDAPGTFNHSLVVSHLAEGAAETIGANPVLARVGAMYHDVGKLLRPMFFIENQSFYGIENPHKSYTPRFSKMLITAHPKDGLELAKEYHLPAVIHSFIMQHHGTSLVSYFYNEALKEEGEDNVQEEQFRYPGPKPNSKETAILMLADAIESAVRAAKTPSKEEIDAIINKIIKERLNDGQLEDSPLTLKDLKTIADTFSRMLRGMHHKRVKYHDDLVNELDKNTKEGIVLSETSKDEVVPPAMLDADLENKINELKNKKNDNL